MTRNRGFSRIQEEREKTSFFKILVGADLLSESMRLIPYKFNRSERKNFPLKVILKVVWGRTWIVNLSEFMGLYLMEKKGWEKFLKDNRLGDDDEFLTFTDIRNNCLAVNIYAKNCKEILAPRDITIFASSSSNVKKEEMSSVGPEIKRAENNNVKREEMSGVGPVIVEPIRRVTMRKKRRAEEEEKKRKKYMKMKKADNNVSVVGPVIAESTRIGTKQKKKRAEEKEDVRKKSKKMKKKNNANRASSSSSAASFNTIIKKSNLLLLTVPQLFAKKHMPKETAEFIIYDPKGKPWEVTYDYNHNRQKLFSCGWRILARDYGLVVGDYCTLTLIKPREMVLEVVQQSP